MKQVLSVRRGGLRAEGPRGLGRDFNGLWGATAASNLGDGLVVALLPLIAHSITPDPAPVAAVTVAATAAWPLFGLPGGLLVDSLDRRSVLIGVSTARACVLAAIAGWSVAGELPLAVLYAGALLLGIGETLADSALTSMVPALVPPERRGAANARVETTINLLNQLVGPPLAGLFIAASVGLAAGATAGTYVLAVMCLWLLPRRRFTPTSRHGMGTGWRQQITAGMRWLWRDHVLRRLTLITALMNIVWAAWTAIFVLYAVAPGPLGLAPAEYGLLLAGMALGGLAVAPVVDPLARRLGVRTLLMLDLLGTAALVAPPAFGLGVVPVALGAVAAGAGSTVWRTLVATIRQNRVADGLLGRVYTASRIISWGVLPVGAAVGGAVAQVYGPRSTFAAATALAVGLVLAFPVAVRRYDLDGAYVRVHEVDAR